MAPPIFQGSRVRDFLGSRIDDFPRGSHISDFPGGGGGEGEGERGGPYQRFSMESYQ